MIPGDCYLPKTLSTNITINCKSSAPPPMRIGQHSPSSQYIFLSSIHSFGTHQHHFCYSQQNGVFSYRLIPLKASMKSICIARQENYAQNRPAATTDFKIHIHPFDELPEIRSHLHPKFAIVELGRKLSKLDPGSFKSLILSSSIYIRIRTIFVAWTNETLFPDNDLSSGWLNPTNGFMNRSALPVSQVGTVLSSWMDYNNVISAKTKKRVDSADASVNQRRCLVENCPNERAVQYCHLVAKKWIKDEDFVRFTIFLSE